MNLILKIWIFAFLTAIAQDHPYTVRDLAAPDGAVIEAGGMGYWPDGTLVLSTRRGEVWTIRNGRWNRFASGLLEPMGLWAGEVGEVYVAQSPEMTRIADINGDLSADRYETVTAGWKVPGATADFVYGLCRDGAGNFYGTMHTTHGPWAKKSLPAGVILKKGQLHGRNSIHNFGGPMGAPAIGRGWCYQVDPKGKLTWWASGLRAPNGVGFNAAGDLFATDNQGDWVGTSALHHIERGAFHGHPSSYHWDPKRTVKMDGPLNELAAKLNKVRKRPAVLFPHGILGNSPSQPVLAPADGRFGPFAGQFFVGDNVAPLLSRVFLEKVGGEYQGACFPFIRERGLRKALCRMVFSPEGKLMVGFGCRGWGPATTGLQEVSWNGEKPFAMQKINLKRDGFEITFTKPLGEGDFARAVTLRSFHYKYHHLYGSPQVDLKSLTVSKVAVSADRRVLHLKVRGLEEGKICEFQVKGIQAVDGSELVNSEAYYTLNQLRTDAKAAFDWEFFPLCMDTHDSAKRSLAEQAALFGELGFDGCGHLCQDLGYGTITHPPGNLLEQRSESFADKNLRIVQAYGRIYLEREEPIDMERIKEMMPTLAANRSQLVLLLLGDRKAKLDGGAVEILGRIADLAKPHGVSIALYPHSGDYTQTLAEALRVVKKVNRPAEVGVMFTFNHWRNCDPNHDLRAVLADAAPWLKSISINGTNLQDAAVLPLDQGSYDVTKVLDILREIDFHGPIGLMCWNIRGDARGHLSASMKQWRNWNSPVKIELDGANLVFETGALKGRIGDTRLVGLKDVIHKKSGVKISGSGRANHHGLLTLYRVFTRNHRYGSAAYDWPNGELLIEGDDVVLKWPVTTDRPFALQARYTFPSSSRVGLEVTVAAKEDLVDFEVQTASYFDGNFPVAEVRADEGVFLGSPKKLGVWHAFPRDEKAATIIGDGRWSRGPSPVGFVMREKFSAPYSRRRHRNGKLAAVLESPGNDCFAIYTAHDGEAHYSNYHALFGRTISAGESAKAKVVLTVEE